MRIGVDARPLIGPPTGIGAYLRGLLAALNRLDQSNEYLLLAHKDFDLPFAGGGWHKRIVRSPFNFSGTICALVDFGRLAAAEKADIYWGTMPVLPRALSVRSILTVHDLVWRLMPQTMTKYNYLVNRFVAESSIARADQVMAVSRSTADDVARLLKVATAQISVVHNGIDHRFYSPPDKSWAAEAVRQRFSVKEEYLLMVGTLEPRKNILRAIEAFLLAAERRPRLQLLIAGGQGWQKLPADYRRSNIHYLGYVTDEELISLYGGAAMLIFPSLYEGFGFPPLQAMACGCPVIASNNSSLPEVCGEAALYIEPTQVAGIASAISLLLENGEKRQQLIGQGLRQAQLFKWERAAESILSLFQELVK